MNKHWVTLKQSNYAELCNKLWEKGKQTETRSCTNPKSEGLK